MIDGLRAARQPQAMTIPLRCDVRVRKVPEPTPGFWVAKLLTTALGESVSDYSVHAINPVFAVLMGWAALVVALALQFRLKRYVPPVYWLAVAMVAVAGTMAADVLHIQFHVPYLVSSAVFAVVLAAVFVTWSRTEPTLSIHSIDTVRREVFYWLAVMATFALGTAAGDLTAVTFNLGYFGSAVMFAAMIAVPALAWGWARASSVACFWAAYVLTRPLGASIADWLGKPRPLGLGWGAGFVALPLAALLCVAVGVLTVLWKRAEGEEAIAAPPVSIAVGDVPPDTTA
jgi:uncharacterized membrane-anchored protein